MLAKAIALTACVVSAPIAFATQQDPSPSPKSGSMTSSGTAQGASQAGSDLAAAKRELEAAQHELTQLGRKLDAALDRLEQQFEPQRDRNCSPTRSRALLTHYQWLRDEGHRARADAVVARIVEQTGNDRERLNSMAWSLMTDKETTGRFDEVALGLAQRMVQDEASLSHHHADTAALAFSLAGQFDRAVALQQLAIERGGNGDEYRRRLRTYQAAQSQLAKAATAGEAPAALLAQKE